MAGFELHQEWMPSDSGPPEISGTMSNLQISVGGINLTRNENIWSRSVHDSIFVSSYPLAMWFLQSWWRLIFEPLPANRYAPDHDWRMAHEPGAANQGFVWPRIVFAADGSNMLVWAAPDADQKLQSVRYLNGLPAPVSLPLAEFVQTADNFVLEVIERLAVIGLGDCPLAGLWNILDRERSDKTSRLYRKLEALMGFDPDECDEDIMRHAIELCATYGEKTIFELAPVFGKTAGGPLQGIKHFLEVPGVKGKPSIEIPKTDRANGSPPWRYALQAAHQVRQQIDNEKGPINTDILFDLLGIAAQDRTKWAPRERRRASVGIPENKEIKFVPRKKHPVSKRFELARFLADHIHTGSGNWLTSTDAGTARQKYQRAFAAEFLCPIAGLREFLQDDFSDSALDDAADMYDVSRQTVTSMLANNGLIERPLQAGLPYCVTSFEF